MAQSLKLSENDVTIHLVRGGGFGAAGDDEAPRGSGAVFVAQGPFRVFEFSQSPPVTALFDQRARGSQIGLRRFPRVVFFRTRQSEQPRAQQQDVSLEQPHRTARRDLPSFVQVGDRARRARPLSRQRTQPGAGQESLGEFVLLASAAEAGHGLFDCGLRIVDCGFRDQKRQSTHSSRI